MITAHYPIRCGLFALFLALFVCRPAMSQQKISLEPCQLSGVKDGGLCGTYEVYEDRRARKGRKISLRIAVLPALDASPEPDALFILAGGPGQGATENANFFARVFAQIRQRRDIVLVDQRGTGSSNGLHCDLYANSLSNYLGDLLPVRTIKNCLTEWETRADLRLYTTSIAMDDLDEVRAALGYERINLFGTSYGTRAAQVYLHQYPDRVRSIILKGVTHHTDAIPLIIAPDAQRSLDKVFADCAKDETCRRAFPDLRREFGELLARFDRGPVRIERLNAGTGKVERAELTRGAFATTLRSLMQSADFIARLPQMIHRAYQGDYGPIVDAAVSFRGGFVKVVSVGMFLSIFNAEDLPGLDPKQVERAAAGTFMGDYYYRQLVAACSLLPRGSVPPDFHKVVRSDVPVLLLSGFLDSSTPPANGDKVAQYLGNSLHVVVRYGSHGYSNNLSPCIDQLMTDFIERGSAKDLDASCHARILQTPFQIQPK